MDKLQRQQAILKFVNDPEWHVIEELLSQDIDNLRDVGTIDITESAETVKARVAGRQETLKLIDNFKHKAEQVKSINKNNNGTPTSFA